MVATTSSLSLWRYFLLL